MFNPYQFIDFPGVSVFEDATVDPQILLFGKEAYCGCTNACAIKSLVADIQNYIQVHNSVQHFSDEAWMIVDTRVAPLNEKLAKGVPLKELPMTINYGLKTGYNDAYSINLKYLICIFNSKLCKYWIRLNCPELGDDRREIRKVYFENFSIPECTDQQPFIDLADRMLALNKDLQEKRARFLRRMEENLGVKITGALETFDMLTFKDFCKELSKQKCKLSLSQQDDISVMSDMYF